MTSLSLNFVSHFQLLWVRGTVNGCNHIFSSHLQLFGQENLKPQIIVREFYFSETSNVLSLNSASVNVNRMPSIMELCFLCDQEYKHFEVCSLIADSLHEYHRYMSNPLQLLQLGIRKYNVVERIQSPCVEKTIVGSNGSIVQARVLPCAINRDWSSPQFYLLRDPEAGLGASVFVLQPTAEGVLTLITYVQNVAVLIDNLR